jgi:hypothetical protein
MTGGFSYACHIEKKTHYGVNPISAGYTERQKYLALHHGWPLPKKRQFFSLGAHWSRPGKTNGGAGTAAAQLASIPVADPRSRNSPIIFARHKRPQQEVSYGSKRIAKLAADKDSGRTQESGERSDDMDEKDGEIASQQERLSPRNCG